MLTAMLRSCMKTKAEPKKTKEEERDEQIKGVEGDQLLVSVSLPG